MNTQNTKVDMTSLGIILMYALVIVAFIYTHTWEFQTSDQSLTWQQPEQSNKKPLISPANYDLAFAGIEQELGSIQYSDSGGIVLNSYTTTTLLRTLEKLPKNMSEDTELRLRYLINQIHPFDKNNQIEALLFNYRKYLKAQTKIDPRKELTLAESEALLLKKIDLKEKIFGKEVTEKLFGSRHDLAFYIINLRKVMRNEHLSQIEKQKKIMELGSELKAQSVI